MLFQLRLARELGKTLAELRRGMSSYEYSLWLSFASLETNGVPKTDEEIAESLFSALGRPEDQ